MKETGKATMEDMIMEIMRLTVMKMNMLIKTTSEETAKKAKKPRRSRSGQIFHSAPTAVHSYLCYRTTQRMTRGTQVSTDDQGKLK